MSKENTGTSKIIWAFGKRSKYAHAFPGDPGIKAGVAICGTRCNPVTRPDHWDLARKEIRDVACPVCMQRLHVTGGMETAKKAND